MKKEHYVGGTFYRICERTGFKVRSYNTEQEWTGRIVREKSWEPRQPQDLVRGTADPQTVPQPRPRQINQFQGPLGTTLSATALAGASQILVTDSTRMIGGDTLTIMLDNGQNFLVDIHEIPNQNILDLSAPLPWSAASGNLVIDVSAMSPTILYVYGEDDDD